MDEFLNAMDVLFDKFSSEDDLLKNISICRTLELDEGFEIDYDALLKNSYLYLP